jgi:hypothetical protein
VPALLKIISPLKKLFPPAVGLYRYRKWLGSVTVWTKFVNLGSQTLAAARSLNSSKSVSTPFLISLNATIPEFGLIMNDSLHSQLGNITLSVLKISLQSDEDLVISADPISITGSDNLMAEFLELIPMLVPQSLPAPTSPLTEDNKSNQQLFSLKSSHLITSTHRGVQESFLKLSLGLIHYR